MASSVSATLTDAPVPAHGPSGADLPPVKLNIVIMSLGTRGDLQPKLEIAKILAHRHGHRVRFAGHRAYKEAVEAEGIEFYSTGRTDPKMMQVRRQLPRKEMEKQMPAMKLEFTEMGESWWGACIGDPAGLSDHGESNPFVADAVISIYQAYDQTSIVARMGIPLHMLGTNARNPSKHVPHSQAERFAKGGGAFKNKFSYWFQDLLFFQTIKPIFNDIRVTIMGLEPFSPIWQMTQFNRVRAPMTYIWSPSLLPKAKDWGSHIDVAGFVFREAPDYEPPAELAEFLAASEEKPVYIGFGSMGFPNADQIYETVLAAIKKSGVRAVIGRSWANWEPSAEKIPNVCVFDEAPHEWLFPRVSACVIHCGAGTTAMALKTGRPIVPLPVAGDQPFWANRIYEMGCGTEPILMKELTVDALAERLDEVQKPRYAEATAEMAAKIATEAPGQEGFVHSALQSFSIYEREGRCDVLPDRPAVWKCTSNGAKVSALAAHILVQEGKVKQSTLEPLFLVKWPDYITPGDPFTGLLKAIGRVWINIGTDFKNISPKSKADDIGDSDGEKVPITMSREPVVSGAGALLFVFLHILRAPLTILVGLCMGFYNFIDFICYELGSRFQPDLFASNPRLYSLPQMLLFLFLKFPSELVSIFTGPGHVIADGRSVGRGFLEVPLALLRALLAGLNILVGVFALPLRAADIQAARLMGERPKEDVVANARIRQGRLEAEQLSHAAAEEGSQPQIQVLKTWGEKFQSRT